VVKRGLSVAQEGGHVCGVWTWEFLRLRNVLSRCARIAKKQYSRQLMIIRCKHVCVLGLRAIVCEVVCV
jgi:hypothetical protein